MGEISEGLVRKLEKAGLTDAEKHVLAIAVGAIGGEAEVEGFRAGQAPGFKQPGLQMGNFEIQDLMSRFNQSETLASSVVINHEEQ